MGQEQFEALVARMETDFAKNPTRFRLRILGLTALGYAYIFSVLCLLFSPVGLLVHVMTSGKDMLSGGLFVPVLVTLSTAIIAAWVRIGRPEGIRLRVADAPEVFSTLLEFQKRLSGPTVHEVYLQQSFEATLQHRPRLGVFGCMTNAIVLGLPLMQALSPEQFRVILAHEYAHLYLLHRGLHGLTRRALDNWNYLITRFAGNEKVWGFLFTRRFNSYASLRDAASTVFYRWEERLADRMSVDITGAEHFADALVNTITKNILLDEVIMPDVFARVASEPAPPPIFSEITESLRSGIGLERAEELLERLRAKVTGPTDLSYSAVERLATIGAGLSIPPPLGQTAAEQMLGSRLGPFLAHMDADWQRASLENWQARHEYILKSNARLDELAAIARDRALQDEEAWERARLTDELRDAMEATDRMHDVIEIDPHHPGANYNLGRILLMRGDDTGIAYVEHAMDIDPLAELPGCEMIREFLRHFGRAEEALPYENRLLACQERAELAESERRSISIKDDFLSHDIAPSALQDTLLQLERFPQVTQAYLVCKNVNHVAHSRFYVLGVVRGRWYHVQSQAGDQKLCDELVAGLNIPDQFFVIVLNSHATSFMKKIKRVPGSRILSR